MALFSFSLLIMELLVYIQQNGDQQYIFNKLTLRYFEDFVSQLPRSFYWRWKKNSWRWRKEVGEKRFEVGGWRMEDLEFKIEDGGQWFENRLSRFEDLIVLHQHSIHTYLFILCRKSHYFEDIIKLWIFRLRTINNFFQVWTHLVRHCWTD